MSTATAPEVPHIELVYEDDQPMDSAWHRAQMELLIQTTHVRWSDRSDYYTGGNMFVYFSLEQVRKRDYWGPDYCTVTGVDGTRERKAWVVWEEGGRYPDVIIELLSPTTRLEDLGTKKDLYKRVFRTPEYFCFDSETSLLTGWRLLAGRYELIAPDASTIHATWENGTSRPGPGPLPCKRRLRAGRLAPHAIGLQEPRAGLIHGHCT